MALFIEVKVTPSSRHYRWSIDQAGRLKCQVKSPPEKGKANAELIKGLAKIIGLPQSEVELIGGHTSRTKKIKISCAMTHQELLDKLGLSLQQPLF